MFHHLSNKKKQIKRAEARTRAILWSKKGLRKKQLKSTQKGVEVISISEKKTSSLNTIPSEVQSFISQTSNKGNVYSLWKAIQDLEVQRQELDTTINVLTKYMEQLSNQFNSNKN